MEIRSRLMLRTSQNNPSSGRLMFRLFVAGMVAASSVLSWSPLPAADPVKEPAKEATAAPRPSGTATPVAAKPITAQDLAGEQRQIAEKFKRFEQVIKLLAQFSDDADQDQARLLRQVFAESQS